MLGGGGEDSGEGPATGDAGSGRRTIAVAVLFVVVLAGAVWLLVDLSVDRLLRAEAERAARSTAAYLLKAVPDIPGVLKGTALPPADSVVDEVRADGAIFRFRLFDTDGQPVFDTNSAGMRLSAGEVPDDNPARAIERGEPISIVRGGTMPEDPRLFGEVYIPIIEEGQTIGALAVYVDQAASRTTMREILGGTVALLVALLLCAFLLPALWLVRRSRAAEQDRLHAESQSRLMASRDEARRLASTDPLTGLLNRSALACAYEDRRKLLSDRDMVLTLLLIDIDHFSAINDGDGHEQGDRVLRALGQILASWTREGDAAGRLGGDEFLLMLLAPRYQDPGERLAERLLERVGEEEAFRGLSVPVSLSIGITTVWKATTGFSDALKQADLALDEAKQKGRGRMTLYEPAMAERYDRRKTMLRQVRDALAAGNIVPAYQPLVSLADRRIVGVEALARWRQGEGELLEATRFAVAFEDPRLATAISERMIEAAVADCGRLAAAEVPFGRLAVNVTEEQVADPDFPEGLLDTLLTNGLSPQDLTIELTENVLLSQREAAVLKTLERLDEAGTTIALDDFGTGFASLTHLRRFPVHRIKLDLSFIRNIAAEPEAHAISAAIISMAHELGIQVVAEGVQTAEIDRMLRELGCDHAQGFYYARPAPIERISQLLSEGLAA